MPKNDGGPAFPRETSHFGTSPSQNGMSLRDYFAGQALAGIMARPIVGATSWKEIAATAYGVADTMVGMRVKDES
jgi:hypothetical protein